MGMFDDPVTRAVVAQQEQKGGGGNMFLNALFRAGDVLSRPLYAAGNEMEALSYQLNQLGRKYISKDPMGADDLRHQQMVGDTNPLTAAWEGITGKDKTGIGEAVAKTSRAYDPNASNPLNKVLQNPVTSFVTNLATDPIAAAGVLGAGGKANKALSALGQGEDAGRAARIAGRVLTPERLQNIDLASRAAGTNPAAVLPGAALMGAARRFIPQADDAVERFFGSPAIPKAVAETPDDLMRQALEKVNASTPEGLMGHAVANSQAAQRGLEGIGGVDVPVSLSRPRPVVNPRVPSPDPGLGIGRALGEPSALPGQVPNMPALPAGPQMGALPGGPQVAGALPRGQLTGPAIAPEGAAIRQAALQKALGASTGKNALFSPEMRNAIAGSSRRGASGSFLSKSVVQDAQQLQEMLNNPDTRQQALRMLRDLVG